MSSTKTVVVIESVKLFQSISCIDNQIPCSSPGNINAIKWGRTCICRMHYKCAPTQYWTLKLRKKNIHICAFISHMRVCYSKKKSSQSGMFAVSLTRSVFVPGVAGERLQAKTIEWHVWTETREAAGMWLLSRMVCRCAAAGPRMRSGRRKETLCWETWFLQAKHS